MIAALSLLPALIIGIIVTRGYAPLPLVKALIWRHRWISAVFVALVATSLAMGIGLMAQERGLRIGTAQAAEKFDLIITAPGSEVTMMLASVFLQPSNVPLLDGETFNAVANHPNVDFAAPLAFGDSYRGAPVVGSTADFVTHLTDTQLEGRMFANSREAVAGANIPVEIGHVFAPAHGLGSAAEQGVHADQITIVGRMPPTGSPWDTSIIVPVESVWEVHGLANGHPYDPAFETDNGTSKLGPPFTADLFPGTPAIIVKAKGLGASYSLQSEFTRDAETMAFFPGAVLANLYNVMGDVRQAISLMTVVTQGLVAISVIVGIFMLCQLFRQQLALLRAIGAPNRFIFAVVWWYAMGLLVIGAGLGLILGWGAAAVLSNIVSQRTQIEIPLSIGWIEVQITAAFIGLTSLLALAPAALALRQPVLRHLRG